MRASPTSVTPSSVAREALAAARNFAASATHELRTPLQTAMTNLDVALAGADSGPGSDAASDAATGGGSIGRARSELSRMATSLATVQALSQAGPGAAVVVRTDGRRSDRATWPTRSSAAPPSPPTRPSISRSTSRRRRRSPIRCGPTVSDWRSTTCCAMHSLMAARPTARQSTSWSAWLRRRRRASSSTTTGPG